MHKLLFWACLIAGLSCGSADRTDPETIGRVPVVMIIFDALDSEHLSHLGYERGTTPNMDALAAEGVSFRKAFSPAPYTLAAIPSIMTGRLPDNHGLVTKKYVLPESETTIAEMLSQAGYPNLAVVGNPNASMLFNAMQGFDRVIKTFEVSDEHPANYTPPSLGRPIHLSSPDDAVRELAPFLDQLEDPADPFFFYAHVLQPHSPYVPPADLRKLWLDPTYDGVFLGGHNKQLIAQKSADLPMTDADREAVIALYDANLLWADQALGQMMDELKARGLFEKSLIIVTSDHGEAMWQHNVWGHNDTLYDEMLQVPLIVRLPGQIGDEVPRGLILDHSASNMDILPSIAQWLDLSPPADLDGVSLAPLINELGKTEDTRVLRLRDHSTPPSVAMRNSKMKGIVHRGQHKETRKLAPQRYEFFDLVQNPAEDPDLIDASDSRAKVLYPFLKEDIVRIRRSWGVLRTGTISRATKATLGALGYVDDGESDGEEEGSDLPLSSEGIDD